MTRCKLHLRVMNVGRLAQGRGARMVHPIAPRCTPTLAEPLLDRGPYPGCQGGRGEPGELPPAPDAPRVEALHRDAEGVTRKVHPMSHQ